MIKSEPNSKKSGRIRNSRINHTGLRVRKEGDVHYLKSVITIFLPIEEINIVELLEIHS